MDFINQQLERPKKSSLASLSDSYQETSLEEILHYQQSLENSASGTEKRLGFGKKDLLERERENLEKETVALQNEKQVFQEKSAALQQLLQSQKAQWEEWKKEAVKHFSEVVFKIAEAVLRMELQLKPERLENLVIDLVQKTYGESDRKLLFHPKDLLWMKENNQTFIDELEHKHQIVLKEDEKLEPNTFTLETSLHQYQENPFLNIEWLKKELYPTS